MATEEIEMMLTEAGIRITAVRLLVLRALVGHSEGVFALQDVCDLLPETDKSSIFRTLTLFAERHLLHTIDDGSGMQKYCLCRCEDHEHHHGHVHLTCTQCHNTLCMESVPIPSVPLPKGFVAEESEYIVKGVCAECQKKGKKRVE